MKNKTYDRILNFLAFVTKGFSKVTVIGLDNIPDGGAIITPNHISQIDPVLLGVALRKKRQVKALAKESLFRAPVIGNAMRGMGHVPVYRQSGSAKEALHTALEALSDGVLLGVYPEGTIPTTLDAMGPFKSGASRLALGSGSPLIPVGQYGAQEILPRGESFKHFLKAIFTRPRHYIIIGEPIAVEKGDMEDRDLVNTLTETLRTSVEKLRESAISEWQKSVKHDQQKS